MITRPLLYFLISLYLLSCSSRGNGGGSGADSTRKDTATVIVPVPVKQEDVPRFKTLHTALPFAGVWVNEIYFDSIRKNHSPRLDQGIVKSCIIIPDSTLKSTNMVAGFHDGGPAIVVVRDGNRYQFYDADLKSPGDTIEPISSTRIRIGDQFFRPLKHPNTKRNDWGILEEILFSGNYQDEDGKKVEFRTDGQITGLDFVSYYEPEIDYSDRAAGQVDRINLGQSHKKMDEYGFRFDKDTLLIYTINCLHYDAGAKECDSARLWDLMWKLRRLPD